MKQNEKIDSGNLGNGRVINEVRDLNFREQLAEGFQNGTLMTSDEFCQRLEALKSLLMKKYQMRYGNNR